jgi:C-terminal processing protease CtpA/Prc
MQGKGYILSNSGRNDIPAGSELVTINGMTLDKIIDLILPALQAQGGNLGWKCVILENDFQNYYYIIEQTDRFDIEYIDSNTNQRIKKELRGISDQSIRTHWSKWYPVEVGAPMSMSFSNNNEVAILTIRSLSKGRYKMYQQDFDGTLVKYFKEIKVKGIKKLIIDVRGNEGGNNPELIYFYIVKQGDTNVKGSADYIKPAKDIFQGPVIVLMDERSISSQETFVAIFKNNDRGLTIGRQTSGSYNGLCGGKKRKIVLPNSRFEINIPLHAENWTFKNATHYQEGQGFPPDIQVDESIHDTMAGKDTVMVAALDRISKL